MTSVPTPRTAATLDSDVRRHLGLLLAATQTAEDETVAELARAETHRLVAAIIAGLRSHRLDGRGACLVCGAFCRLRHEISIALLPARRLHGARC